jgi:hypothetical protein
MTDHSDAGRGEEGMIEQLYQMTVKLGNQNHSYQYIGGGRGRSLPYTNTWIHGQSKCRPGLIEMNTEQILVVQFSPDAGRIRVKPLQL